MSKRPTRGRAAQAARPAPIRIVAIAVGIVVVVALALLGTSLLQSRQAATTTAPTPSGPAPEAPSVPTGRTAEGFYYKGNPDAKVVVTEYGDYQWPGCGYFARAAGPTFEQQYVADGRVKLVFADYPLQVHPNAVPAAEAARCAGDQSKYWQMHDLLFANQNQWSNLPDASAQFAAYAQHLGLDTAAFSSCLANGTHRQEVLQARAAAEQLGLPGTPSFAVNGTPVDTTGAQSVDDIVTSLRQAVDTALAAQ